MELTVRVHRENDTYWAEVVELPGCFASGDTLDELTQALSEAISLVMADDPKAGVVELLDPPGRLEIDELKVLVPSS